MRIKRLECDQFAGLTGKDLEFEKGLNIISIAIDAPMDRINSLSGALGRLEGINARVTYAKA